MSLSGTKEGQINTKDEPTIFKSVLCVLINIIAGLLAIKWNIFYVLYMNKITFFTKGLQFEHMVWSVPQKCLYLECVLQHADSCFSILDHCLGLWEVVTTLHND